MWYKLSKLSFNPLHLTILSTSYEKYYDAQKHPCHTVILGIVPDSHFN